MSVMSICSKNVVVVHPEASLQEAALLMEERSVGCLVVVQSIDSRVQPIAVITDRDLVTKAVARSVAMSSERVESYMSSRVVTIRSDATVSEAVWMMKANKIRRIVVVDHEGQLCGLLSVDDLVRSGQATKLIGELMVMQTGTDQRHRTYDFTRMA